LPLGIRRTSGPSPDVLATGSQASASEPLTVHKLSGVGEHEIEQQGEVLEEELDPEREARRRLALAQIRQYPDPVLRMRANEIESFDDDLRRLVERMMQLMQEANGVGLAGTQVGTLQRVFVFQPEAEDEPPRAIVNPVVVDKSDDAISDTEGCLSLQGVTIPVERQAKVTVEGKDENGKDVRLELEERDARVVQHELDHLEGILILDRTTAEARREAMGILRPEPVLGALS
jgi:peptide deformylase